MKHPLQFLPAVLILSGLLQAATLTGIVGSPAPGNPVAGAKVVLILGTNTGLHVDSTVTNDSGAYTFNNVTTGVVFLLTSKTGYYTGTAFQNVSSTTTTVTANISMTRNGTPIQPQMARKTKIGNPQSFAVFDLKGGFHGRSHGPGGGNFLLVAR